VSYQQLADGPNAVDRAAAGAFGLLGLLDGPEVGVPVVARLLEVAEDAAERALERLVDAQLLETPRPGRYRLHDLLRLYARELADQHYPEPVRAAALTRALGFYVASAWNTLAVLRPGDYRLARADGRWRKGGLEFANQQAALGWLEAERANLLAAVRQATATLRRLVVDGVPVVTGLHAVGDSVCTTNPTLGRGLSLALQGAVDPLDRDHRPMGDQHCPGAWLADRSWRFLVVVACSIGRMCDGRCCQRCCHSVSRSASPKNIGADRNRH
jgi:hypothetical protein